MTGEDAAGVLALAFMYSAALWTIVAVAESPSDIWLASITAGVAFTGAALWGLSLAWIVLA